MPEKIYIENDIPMSGWLGDIIPIKCGYVYRDGVFRLKFPCVYHNPSVIHCIYKGVCCYECRGVRYELHPGDVFIFPKKELVSYWSDEDLEYHWVVVGGNIEKLFTETDTLVFHTNKPEVFREMFELSKKGELTGTYAASKVLEVIDGNVVAEGGVNSSAYIRQAKLIVKAHNGVISVRELAEKVGLSYGYFSMLFKENTGITAKEYITKEALTIAETLLKVGMPISDVAEAVGYSDRFTFSKAYNKYKGKTPGKTKRKTKEKD